MCVHKHRRLLLNINPQMRNRKKVILKKLKKITILFPKHFAMHTKQKKRRAHVVRHMQPSVRLRLCFRFKVFSSCISEYFFVFCCFRSRDIIYDEHVTASLFSSRFLDLQLEYMTAHAPSNKSYQITHYKYMCI